MSAVEDFSRYVDTRCVCGHPKAMHANYSDSCFAGLYVAVTDPVAFAGCGCAQFEADDRKPTPESCLEPDHNADRYDGQYKPKGGYRL